MDLITTIVRENANITKEQSHKAIEAVLAYVVHECGEPGEKINKAVLASNASSAGGDGIDWIDILNSYKEKYGSIADRLKAAAV